MEFTNTHSGRDANRAAIPAGRSEQSGHLKPCRQVAHETRVSSQCANLYCHALPGLRGKPRQISFTTTLLRIKRDGRLKERGVNLFNDMSEQSRPYVATTRVCTFLPLATCWCMPCDDCSAGDRMAQFKSNHPAFDRLQPPCSLHVYGAPVS